MKATTIMDTQQEERSWLARKLYQLKKTVLGGLHYFKLHPTLYLMLVPGLICLAIFEFTPYYGLQIAFKDFNIFLGDNAYDAIRLSEWNNFATFKSLFGDSHFWKVLRNTLYINALRIFFLFPIPIFIAIFLKEVTSKLLKRCTQTMIFVPYFFSWVVIHGIFTSLLGTYGMINSLLELFGVDKMKFFSDPNLFIGVLMFTDGWKSVGYNAIVFIAAGMAIPTEQYEAAKIDGASKWQEIWHITIPAILPTIILMLILRIGNILGKGFEQVLLFYNVTVYDVADIIQTWIFRNGIGKMDFSRSTALGLFNAVVSAILVITSNWISTKTVKKGIW